MYQSDSGSKEINMCSLMGVERGTLIQLSQARWEAICRLSTLSNVAISGSSLASGESPPSVGLPLHVSGLRLKTAPVAAGNDHWILRLASPHLRFLSCAFEQGGTIQDTPLFPNVHTLETSSTASENQPLLSKFPAAWQPPRAIPAKYSPPFNRVFGDCYALRLFLPAPHLTHLYLKTRAPPAVLFTCLEAARGAAITSLYVKFEELNLAMLDTFSELLPNLTELFIRVRVVSMSEMFNSHVDSVDKLDKSEFMSVQPRSTPRRGRLRRPKITEPIHEVYSAGKVDSDEDDSDKDDSDTDESDDECIIRTDFKMCYRFLISQLPLCYGHISPFLLTSAGHHRFDSRRPLRYVDSSSLGGLGSGHTSSFLASDIDLELTAQRSTCIWNSTRATSTVAGILLLLPPTCVIISVVRVGPTLR
ncbi:hypothetical protein FB45DRAFT_872275 [Roridomyces roridus]|uniref:Uncharacterized protein n=1 Tax=Roridomyces roridus TaxID=1738132 RepID=A0AAD7BD70_9AGAR|nr:hypothetical protein FB45DRAFT_872275 [Roridomyces roridus]